MNVFLFVPSPLVGFFFTTFFRRSTFRPLMIFHCNYLVPIRTNFRFRSDTGFLSFYVGRNGEFKGFPRVRTFRRLYDLL